MVNRSFADMRRTPVSPASSRAFFIRIPSGFYGGFSLPSAWLQVNFGPVTTDSHARRIIEDYSFVAQVMTSLALFVCVWPLALAALLRFAARVDPRSGRVAAPLAGAASRVFWQCCRY